MSGLKLNSYFCRVLNKQDNLRSPVSAIYARVHNHIWDVSFFHSGEHFLTTGATFLFQCDFSFSWCDFFFPARLFFFWRDFFFLARLFVAGSVNTSCIPYYSVFRTACYFSHIPCASLAAFLLIFSLVFPYKFLCILLHTSIYYYVFPCILLSSPVFSCISLCFLVFPCILLCF